MDTLYRTVETDEPVGDGTPELVTFFQRRADRRCRKLNSQRQVDFYRYEVQKVYDQREGKQTRWRWGVIAMQNKAVRV